MSPPLRDEWDLSGQHFSVGVRSIEPIRVAARYADGKENGAQSVNADLAEEVAQTWQAYLVRRIVRLNREGRYSEAIKRLDRNLPLFAKYAPYAKGGGALLAELQRLRDVADRDWNEGSRKEVEMVMYKRVRSVADARAAAPAQWTDELPG